MSFYLLGDEDTVLGYQFAGVTGRVINDRSEALDAFTAALEGDHKILLITDQVALNIEEEITAHRLEAKPPYVVFINSIWGEETERRNLEEVIQEAVGIRIGK